MTVVGDCFFGFYRTDTVISNGVFVALFGDKIGIIICGDTVIKMKINFEMPKYNCINAAKKVNPFQT